MRCSFFWSLILVAAVVGCSGSVSAPTKFAEFNAEDGSFACEYPAEWEANGGGSRGFYWARFETGGAEIYIDTNVSSSLLGDIAGSQNQMLGIDEEEEEDLAPAAAIHEFEKVRFVEEMSDFQEDRPEVVESALGDGRKSKFTAAGGFGGKLCGYRVTILSLNKRVGVVCKCSEKNWETLKPAFDRTIDSLKYGVAER